MVPVPARRFCGSIPHMMETLVAVVSALIAAASLVVAILMVKHSSGSSKAAQDSAAAAEVSAETGREAAAAAQRQAEAAEQGLEINQQMLHEARRANDIAQKAFSSESRIVMLEESARPNVKIESGKGQTYVLRNVGVYSLSDVSVHTGHPQPLVRNLPVGETLAPGEARVFLLADSMQAALPTEVEVTWEGQDEPIVVPLPTKA